MLTPAVALAQAPTLTGTAGNDILNGTPGADVILALSGDDAVTGAGGPDDIDGGPGADDLRGGPGEDAVLYGGRTAAIAFTLDDVANDGEAGEGDDVHADIEQIFGARAVIA